MGSPKKQRPERMVLCPPSPRVLGAHSSPGQHQGLTWVPSSYRADRSPVSGFCHPQGSPVLSQESLTVLERAYPPPLTGKLHFSDFFVCLFLFIEIGFLCVALEPILELAF